MKLFNILFLSSMFIFLFCTETAVNNTDPDNENNDTIFDGSIDTSHWSNSYNMQITVHDSSIGIIWQNIEDNIYYYYIVTSKDSVIWDTVQRIEKEPFLYLSLYKRDFEVDSYKLHYIKLIGSDSVLSVKRVLDEGKCNVVKDVLQIAALRSGREVELDYEAFPAWGVNLTCTAFKSKDKVNWDTLAYQAYLGGYDFLFDNDTTFYKVIKRNDSTGVEISSNIISAQFQNEDFDFLAKLHSNDYYAYAYNNTSVINKYTEIDTVLHFFSHNGDKWFPSDSQDYRTAYLYLSNDEPLVYYYQVIKTTDGNSYISKTTTLQNNPIYLNQKGELESILIDSIYTYLPQISYEHTHDTILNQNYELYRSINGGEFIKIDEGYSDSNYSTKIFIDTITELGYAEYVAVAYFNNGHIINSDTLRIETPLPLTYLTPYVTSLLDMAFLNGIVGDSLVGIADVVVHRSLDRNYWNRIDTVALVSDTFFYVDTLSYAGAYYYATSILFSDTCIETIKCLPQLTYVTRLAPATFQYPMIKRVSATINDIMLPDISEVSEGVDSIQLLKYNDVNISQSKADSLIWEEIGTRIFSPVVIRDTASTPVSYAIRYFYDKYASHISKPINSNYHELLYMVDSTLIEGELTTPAFGAEIEADGNLQIEWDPQLLPNDTNVRIRLFDEGISSIELTQSTSNDGSYYYDGYENIGEGLYQIVLMGTTTNPYGDTMEERFVSAPFIVYAKD